jgi:membrane protein
MFGPLMTTPFWRDLYAEITEDNVFNGAAALAYYLTLSIFPAFIVIMTVIPYLPIDNVDRAIMDMLQDAMPAEAADLLEGTVAEVTQQQRGGLLSLGIVFTLWAVSTGMYAIMQHLNITYDVKEGRSYIKARIVALVLSVGFVVLVVGAFSLIVLGGVIEEWLFGLLGQSGALILAFRVFRWLMIVLALLAGFALVYRYAPNVEQKFRFVTPGAVIGVILLIVASLGFSIYISNFADYSATYGSIGAVIILMFWLYIAGLVLLIGSEINALIEHYDPAGKQKGEKHEPIGSSPDNAPPLHASPARTRRSPPGEPNRSGLFLAGVLMLVKAFRRRP